MAKTTAQGRAVSKEDYISVLQNNKLGYSFDAVNVWGGQENTPPVFGQVFISIKPAGRYNLTSSEKLKIREENKENSNAKNRSIKRCKTPRKTCF